jgi:hypothetical protein
LRHDTETFRRILKAYKLESDEWWINNK